jgi:hypothetical protein
MAHGACGFEEAAASRHVPRRKRRDHSAESGFKDLVGEIATDYLGYAEDDDCLAELDDVATDGPWMKSAMEELAKLAEEGVDVVPGC